ncbi:MAG: tannase/feruloyl esterase family alpha/beta hydrolase, partial [Betaproteobacteria bacterium]
MAFHATTHGRNLHGFRALLLAASLAISFGLAGCSGGNGGSTTTPSVESPVAADTPLVDCVELARLNLSFEGDTTVTAATAVTSGTLVTPDNQTITGLPAFCRVQGVSKPSADSLIRFEVWLPTTIWNGRFLSTGEGGFGGQLNYANGGLDGGLDAMVRRGYASASTDNGHVGTDTGWAVNHPEKIVDYAFRAK